MGHDSFTIRDIKTCVMTQVSSAILCPEDTKPENEMKARCAHCNTLQDTVTHYKEAPPPPCGNCDVGRLLVLGADQSNLVLSFLVVRTQLITKLIVW